MHGCMVVACADVMPRLGLEAIPESWQSELEDYRFDVETAEDAIALEKLMDLIDDCPLRDAIRAAIGKSLSSISSTILLLPLCPTTNVPMTRPFLRASTLWVSTLSLGLVISP